ncbi:hypothetical protein GQX73_g10607 [Xylaria multiplex]|uniref:Uncharacterized protein n=1 Tax=Xylaria multiplex TaxID=323545 RepID=A0A7C8IGD0_9PEZI|nr:hypothetical protein GQX73_g10607 [Xylaria multiplex]
MSHPTSSAVDALQAHFKGGLQPPSSRPSQAQLDTDDGSMSQTRQLDQNPGHSHHARISRTSPPPSYPDPLILADDGYHGQLPPNQPIHVENDTTGRAAIAQNNLISILPKPISITKGQRVFSTAIWNDQVNFALKRKAEDDFIDPRLSRAPGSEYTGVPGMGMSPNYTSPASSGVPVAVHHSLPGQGFNTDHLSQGTDAVGIHRPIRALGLEVDSDIVDSATDALLERQLDLRDGSDEEGDLEDRREGPSRYHDEDDEQQRGRRGRGRGRGGRGRGARRGPRKAAEPTGDVKYRINMASNAYMDGRLDEAIEWVEDAIRINAETYRAWTLLASLLEEKGDPKGSFTARLFSCHLQPKHVEGWLHCAEIGIELRDELPQDAAHFLEQVSTCYSAALRADINNRPARHGRAAIAAERGQIRTAAKDYLYLLEHGEYDVHALRSYAEMTMILASAGKRNLYTPSSAIDWYYRAFTHFRSNGMDDRHPLEWQDINYFAGLLSYVEHTKDALYELKSLARWLLGRSDESFWDDWQDDDREWDIDSARRIGLENFQYGKYPESSYGSGLPLDMRTKLAVYRLKLGDVGEAQRHISHIDPNGPDGTEVLSNEPHLLAEIGCALYESELRTMALCFFEPLLNVPDVLDSAALLAAGRCYLDAGDKRQAEECFGAAIDADESNDEASIDARYELAKMYEAAREEQEAYILVNEALRLQQAHDEAEGENEEEDMVLLEKRDRKTNAPPRRLKPRTPRLNKDGHEIRRPRPRRKVFGRTEEVTLEEKRRAEELTAAWRTVHYVREPVNNINRIGPSDAFMRAAKELVDDFRSCKGFYSWEKYLTHLGIDGDKQVYVSRNRNLIEMKERLSHNLNPYGSNTERQLGERTAVSYRGVSFSEWLDLFLEYAVGLAHHGRFQESYQVCESARDAEVFAKSKEDMFLIHVTWAACALRARDEETCVAAARFLMRDRQFDSDPFRMFAALCRLCPSPASWYASGPVQKYMLRQIKLMDRALVSGGGEDSEEEETKVNGSRIYASKELDVTLLVLYGHILFVSNSFTYALNYFLRAYSIDPSNQMILLSVGQCYIHYALKRQSENRQYLLVQGFVFLHRYYNLKVSSTSAAERQEAHYNMARSYHAIGIPHLAAEFYQRVLRDIPDDSEPNVLGNNDLSQEAAYNLQQICWAGGDLGAVKSLSREEGENEGYVCIWIDEHMPQNLVVDIYLAMTFVTTTML